MICPKGKVKSGAVLVITINLCRLVWACKQDEAAHAVSVNGHGFVQSDQPIAATGVPPDMIRVSLTPDGSTSDAVSINEHGYDVQRDHHTTTPGVHTDLVRVSMTPDGSTSDLPGSVSVQKTNSLMRKEEQKKNNALVDGASTNRTHASSQLHVGAAFPGNISRPYPIIDQKTSRQRAVDILFAQNENAKPHQFHNHSFKAELMNKGDASRTANVSSGFYRHIESLINLTMTAAEAYRAHRLNITSYAQSEGLQDMLTEDMHLARVQFYLIVFLFAAVGFLVLSCSQTLSEPSLSVKTPSNKVDKLTVSASKGPVKGGPILDRKMVFPSREIWYVANLKNMLETEDEAANTSRNGLKEKADRSLKIVNKRTGMRLHAAVTSERAYGGMCRTLEIFSFSGRSAKSLISRVCGGFFPQPDDGSWNGPPLCFSVLTAKCKHLGQLRGVTPTHFEFFRTAENIAHVNIDDEGQLEVSAADGSKMSIVSYGNGELSISVAPWNDTGLIVSLVLACVVLGHAAERMLKQ